jgi:hypothetical protein
MKWRCMDVLNWIKEIIYQIRLEKNWDERTGTAPKAFEITEEERIQLEKNRTLS